MKKCVLWLAFGLLAVGCTSESPLERALRLGGGNRGHLEQVLRHYSRHPADSLKYRAARFLIENMPGHGWYDSPELEAYRHWVDSVHAGKWYAYRAMLHELGLQWHDVSGELTFYQDIEHLDSTFLITHIDSTFSGASRRPWLADISFETFCEYVLPYRVGHERPRLLYALQDSLYRADVEGLLGYDDSRYDPLPAFQAMPLYPPSLRNASAFYRGHSLHSAAVACQGIDSYCRWRAKLLMCPAATDLIPAYPKRNDRHCWTVLAGDGRIIGENDAAASPAQCGKIYRHTFSRQPVPLPVKGEQVPSFFQNPFYKDVTCRYGAVSDVSVPAALPVANGYLCVFNDLKWKPIAWAPLEKGRFCFKDMGGGIVYLPMAYPGGKAVAVSCPFILHPTGRTEVLRPDTARLLTLRLDRKYPLSHTVKSANRDFTQAFVEASDDARFLRADSLGGFGAVSLRQWSVAPVASSRAYRYWRIHSPKLFILGECLLYDGEGNRIVPDSDTRRYHRTAFDDDPISYAYSDASNSLVMDFGRAVRLSKVECLLRNDGNAVWPGHWYELFYHDGTAWRTLGMRQAQERWVEFDGVPSGALLWLRDLSEGVEERIFTVKDNQIRFW